MFDKIVVGKKKIYIYIYAHTHTHTLNCIVITDRFKYTSILKKSIQFNFTHGRRIPEFL